MNWNAIGAVAELIGALGVVASLVRVATHEVQRVDLASLPESNLGASATVGGLCNAPERTSHWAELGEAVRAAFALMIALTAIVGCRTADESSLRSDFAENRAAFDEILAMFQEDSHLVRVAFDFTRLENDWSWPRENVGLTDERWDRYRELFRRAELDTGIERQGDHIFFFMSSVGLGISGRSRGVAYSTAEPVELAADLDSRPGEGISYVPIRDHWYLFDWAH